MKIEFGTISGIDQYGYAYDCAKFGACIKNRTIHELCCWTTCNLKDHTTDFDATVVDALNDRRVGVDPIFGQVKKKQG